MKGAWIETREKEKSMNRVIYQDGTSEEITEDLLENGSELQMRNVPLSYLRLVVGKRRNYKGTMGVTTALNGHRYNYLRYKVLPDIDLDGSAFMALGIGAHSMMDDNAADKDKSEVWLEDGKIVGRSDTLETVAGLKVLNDYKVSGSFKVAKAMGIVEGPKKPVYDEYGNPVLYRRSGKGYKAGDQKMEKTWIIDPEKREHWEYSMQLNKYRIMFKKQFGTEPDLMNIYFIVRDGDTISARSRGVLNRTYLLEIPKIEDEKVDEFYNVQVEKFDEIMTATADIEGTPGEVIAKTIASGVEIPMCDTRENWNGRRCENYCSYASVCKMFGDNPYLGKE